MFFVPVFCLFSFYFFFLIYLRGINLSSSSVSFFYDKENLLFLDTHVFIKSFVNRDYCFVENHRGEKIENLGAPP